MDMGQKIKQARLEAGLSQRQLCGDTITRNMLSLIESGRARPGMDTLCFLAGRLGKPVSYFLEEDAVMLPNRQVMDDARQAYCRGDWADALAALEEYQGNDPVFDRERYLVEGLCLTELAAVALDAGKTAYARALLQRAESAAEKTPYADGLTRKRLLLSARAWPEQAENFVSALPSWDVEALARGWAAYSRGDYGRCAEILEASESRNPEWFLLRGMGALEQGLLEAAAQYLRRAEEALPDRVAVLLERCYRELGDYKLAYEYAVKRRKDP